ncbi:MAG: response regulator transcription factor [Candidatus Nanopelagicales bacterium]|jgi:DNA-binding NarL/FixJ family response regulator|nr:response regulator transcription factor [Candidatus Nanopelagicales bacterium]
MTEPTQLAAAAPVRVLIVDDHALVRSGVRAQLDGHVSVVGEADDVASAVDAVLATRPDVVLLDVHLPSGTGADVIGGVGDRAPGTRWLALSISDAPEDVVTVIRAGAHGYLTKSVSAQGLLDAVHRVAEGDAVFSPRLAGFVLDSFRTDPALQPAAGPAADPDLDSLTTREVEVLTLIARGYTYREAATELYVSVRTIETHVSAVLRKLQLSNRRELARWAHARDLH